MSKVNCLEHFNLQEVTEKLDNILRKEAERVSEEDVETILNLQLPIRSVDSILLVTKYTNEKLEEAKDNIIKNIGLVKDQIDILKECVGPTDDKKNKRSLSFTQAISSTAANEVTSNDV